MIEALIGIIIGALIFGGGDSTKIKCPEYIKETGEVFKTVLYAVNNKTGEVVRILDENVSSSTLKFVNKDILKPNESFSFKKVLEREVIDPERVEHNKRVKDCKTLNGDF